MTLDQWSALIARWNRLAQHTRRADWQRCMQTGHERVQGAGHTGEPFLMSRTCWEYIRLPDGAWASHAD